MALIDSEYLKENGYMVFQYQKDGKGNEGVLPVNIDDIPPIEQTGSSVTSRTPSGKVITVNYSYTHKGRRYND